MNKKTIKLIWDLNSLYDSLWNIWTLQWSDKCKYDDYSKKLKLIKVITKNIVEQKRWFLKSQLDYSKSWYYILNNISIDYKLLHKEVSNLLLDI